MNFNKQQILTVVGTLLTVGGSIATATGKFTPEQWSGFSKAVMDTATAGTTLAGMILVWWQQRKEQQVKAAASIEGVRVQVDTATAPAPVVDLAKSDAPEAKDIIPSKPAEQVAAGK